MMITDACHRLTDRAGHAHSRSLGRRARFAIAATEADRTRELAHEKVAFAFCLRRARGISGSLRLVEIFFDLGEPRR